MAVAVRSTSTAQIGSGASLAVTKPAGTTSGDLLVAVVFQDSDGYASNGSLTAPSGWGQAGSTITESGTSPWGKVFTKAAGTSEPTSYSFNLAPSSSCAITMFALTGANTTTPIRIAPVANASGSGLVAPQIAAGSGQQAGDLLICAFAVQGGTNTFTNGSGMGSFIQASSNWVSDAAGVHPLTDTTTTPSESVTASVAVNGNPRTISMVIALGQVNFSGSATGTVKLSATRTGSKTGIGSPTGTARLSAACTGAKTGEGSPTGVLRLSSAPGGSPGHSGSATGTVKLSGSATGKVINVVHATLKLSAAIPAYAVAGKAAVTATLRLSASAAAAPTHRSGTPTAGLLHLAAAQAGQKESASTQTGLLHLAASPGVGAKRVAVTPTALLHLLASTSAGVHTTADVPVTGVLLLSTNLHNRIHTTVAGEVDTTPLRLSAELNAKRIFTEAAVALRAKASQAVSYELVCVARIPSTQGVPTFLQVDPIDWSGLSYADELSKPQQLNAGCQIAGLTEPVLQRLRDLAEQATELWLYRNGVLVFAGPLLGWQVQGEALTLNAQGLLAYLNMMVVQTDLVYKQADQFSIVTGLIDQWQNLDYGNFGIDTSGISSSGIKRDATYLKTELHNVGQRVFELGQHSNGFDVAVNPKSRKLELSYPQRGIDRSTGEDAIVFDARNVTSPNIVASAAPGDVASEAFVTGTSATGGNPIYATASNTELRAKYGRTAVTASYQDVSVQATANDYATALEAARGAALLIPGPDVRVTPDSDLRAYDVGDTVSYTLHEKLSVAGAFRLRKRQVTVSQTGQESVTVQFT